MNSYAVDSPVWNPSCALRDFLFGGVAVRRGGAVEFDFQGSIPSDPGIRGPLHPPRHRSPPSSYRIGTPQCFADLAGGGASTLSCTASDGHGTPGGRCRRRAGSSHGEPRTEPRPPRANPSGTFPDVQPTLNTMEAAVSPPRRSRRRGGTLPPSPPAPRSPRSSDGSEWAPGDGRRSREEPKIAHRVHVEPHRLRHVDVVRGKRVVRLRRRRGRRP